MENKLGKMDNRKDRSLGVKLMPNWDHATDLEKANHMCVVLNKLRIDGLNYVETKEFLRNKNVPYYQFIISPKHRGMFFETRSYGQIVRFKKKYFAKQEDMLKILADINKLLEKKREKGKPANKAQEGIKTENQQFIPPQNDRDIVAKDIRQEAESLSDVYVRLSSLESIIESLNEKVLSQDALNRNIVEELKVRGQRHGMLAENIKGLEHRLEVLDQLRSVYDELKTAYTGLVRTDNELKRANSELRRAIEDDLEKVKELFKEFKSSDRVVEWANIRNKPQYCETKYVKILGIKVYERNY